MPNLSLKLWRQVNDKGQTRWHYIERLMQPEEFRQRVIMNGIMASWITV